VPNAYLSRVPSASLFSELHRAIITMKFSDATVLRTPDVKGLRTSDVQELQTSDVEELRTSPTTASLIGNGQEKETAKLSTKAP
jgi:hypothetical protein